MSLTNFFLNSVLLNFQNRCRLFRAAQEDLKGEGDWTFASTHFGITTYYRREADDSLSIKLEGDLEGVPLFEQVCVIKEVDLHYTWSPFCSSSLTVADLDKLDVVGWFLIGMPNFGLARDGCFRAIGCDNIAEDGTIILTGQGVKDVKPTAPPPNDTYLSHDPIIDQLDIPPIPKRRGSGRMTIRKFQAMIEVLSPTSAKTLIVANIDPNLSFMPQSLLDFIMKHLAGVILSKMQTAAKKVVKNPAKNEHAKKMREEEEFYKKWLMAKFQDICDARGWEMPEVAAFDYSTTQSVRFESSRLSLRRAHTSPETGTSRTQQGVNTSDSGVLENMSAISSPQLRNESDEVSELTSRSGLSSVWRNNPVAAYMREMEIRTQKRKAAKVAASRQMASDRLRPKPLSERNLDRLKELKAAKARRQSDDPKLPNSPRTVGPVPVTNPSRSLTQRITSQLYSHSAMTRIVVVGVLLKMLFALLHTEIAAISPSTAGSQPWSEILLDDAWTVLYMLICGTVYFILCDVALCYSFSSLELGMKSGRQVKQFYGDNVRIAVAVFSFSIVGIGVFKALLKAWMRVGIWLVAKTLVMGKTLLVDATLQIYGRLSSVLPIDGPVHYLQELSSMIVSGIGKTAAGTSGLARTLLDIFYRLMVKSNFVGRSIAFLVGRCYDALVFLVVTPLQPMADFVAESSHRFDAKATMTAWRADAFSTSRVLFSYTSVFLLSVLVLYYLTSKSRDNGKRKTDSVSDSERNDPMEPVQEIKNQFSNISSISDDSIRESFPRRSKSPHVAIPEDEELLLSADSPQAASPGTASTGTMNGLKLRLRRKKPKPKSEHASSPTNEQSGRGLRHAHTY